jgi:hypothetical protein
VVPAEAGDGGRVLAATGRRGRATVDAKLPRRIGRTRPSGMRPLGHVSCAVLNGMNGLPRILVPAGILAAIPGIFAPRQDLIDRRDDDATIAANPPPRSTPVKAKPHRG